MLPELLGLTNIALNILLRPLVLLNDLTQSLVEHEHLRILLLYSGLKFNPILQPSTPFLQVSEPLPALAHPEPLLEPTNARPPLVGLLGHETALVLDEPPEPLCLPVLLLGPEPELVDLLLGPVVLDLGLVGLRLQVVVPEDVVVDAHLEVMASLF